MCGVPINHTKKGETNTRREEESKGGGVRGEWDLEEVVVVVVVDQEAEKGDHEEI